MASSLPLLGGLPTSLPPRSLRKTSYIRLALLAVALVTLAVLYGVRHEHQPPSALASVHQYLVDGANATCKDQDGPACTLSGADLDTEPHELFRLLPVRESVTAGAPLYLEVVATAEVQPECLLRSSVFSVVVSGSRLQRAQLVDAPGQSLVFAVQLDEPGKYRIEAFLRLFNDPHFFCEMSVVRMTGARYIDRVVAGGNATVVVRPSWTASLPALSSSPSKRPCRYGDLFDMRGSWAEAPVPATPRGDYEKQHVCALEPLPTPAEAFARAVDAGVRWLRFVGDSNTRYLYESFPLVDPSNTAFWSIRKGVEYTLRSACGAVYDSPSARQRNPRATRRFCRVGLADGDPQDDVVVSWEWFTPVHAPPLSAHFDDEANAYWANSTLGGLFTPVEEDPRHTLSPIQTILADRPDLLALRGGDRVFLSYGSHAVWHTRDDVEPYVDQIVAAAERLSSLEAADVLSPQKRLSFGLSTAKSCRKFKSQDTPEVTAGMLRICHSDNFHDKNLAILRAFAARGLTWPDGESVPPAARLRNLAPLDVLDFWHTTESVEDYMTDKVHFGPGVYFTHSRMVATSVFEEEV
ncbi:hypothetical protein JCM3775_000825 [Rhodotorula graminis]